MPATTIAATIEEFDMGRSLCRSRFSNAYRGQICRAKSRTRGEAIFVVDPRERATFPVFSRLEDCSIP
jgi:hypothetical protein